jgi:SIR2-like domain
VSFAIFARRRVRELVDRFAGSGPVTVIVGAGASVEATLPDWQSLIRRLLERASRSVPELADEASRAAWAEETLKADGLLGAAAVVEALSKEQLQTWIVEGLYERAPASSYRPGPISEQVAFLHRCLGTKLTIATSNYDDLLEEALRDGGIRRARIRSYITGRRGSEGAVGVIHLHGYAGRDRTKGTLILSEEQYQRMQRGQSWQERFVGERLLSTNCLFVGTSLTDPNLIRYLYGYRGQRRHAALFVRQAESPTVAPDVRKARETAMRERWNRCGVEVLFLDHFSDVAQVLNEIGYRAVADSYVPVDQRARRWIGRIERDIIGINHDRHFELGQRFLSDRLRSLLARAVSVAELFGADFSHEVLAASLWLANRDGTHLTSWATTDRLHRDRATIEPVKIEVGSKWVSVATFCRGTRVEEDRDVYASRWRYVRGLPLYLEETQGARLPIGCLTVTSSRPGAETMLERMDDGVKASFHESLTAGTIAFLRQA